jgi:uncharacterized protein GlcG (DUF336 family)
VVLDAGGHIIVLKREDGSGIMRPELAIAKAYGALGLVITLQHTHMIQIKDKAFIATPLM